MIEIVIIDDVQSVLSTDFTDMSFIIAVCGSGFC